VVGGHGYFCEAQTFECQFDFPLINNFFSAGLLNNAAFAALLQG
jgi:hypothetical protein